MCVHTIICFKHKVHHYTESEASVIFVNEKENGVKQENNKFVNEKWQKLKRDSKIMIENKCEKSKTKMAKQ